MRTPQNAILEPVDSTNNLNIIIPLDEEGPGGAHHRYAVHRLDTGDLLGEIIFQTGPRKDENSIMGALDTDLLEIVRDRLIDFSNGPLPNEHSNKALSYIEQALQELKARVDERAASGTLGTMNK